MQVAEASRRLQGIILNRVLIVITFIAVIRSAAFADTVILVPSKDNTLYEDGAGSLSNGSGIYIFAGRTAAPSLRRGLIAFNFASIPTNATITGATLSMFLSKTHGGSASITLSKALRDWGEGASNAGEPGGAGIQAEPGDATWFHTFYSTSFWVAHGGDFSTTVSAITTVNAVNTTYTWSGSGLLADVQSWVSNPASNFGWAIRGNETTSGKAQRFNAHENTSNPPQLTVTYVVSGPTPTPTVAPTPTPSPAPTQTPTATPAPTQTPTPTATPTPAQVSISGSIVDCSNPVLDPAAGVTLNLTGDMVTSTTTDGSGNYQFLNLPGGGTYTVTPSMAALTPGSSGIDTVDVIATQRHFLSIAILPPGCRRISADVNGDAAVTTTDVIAIQRFFLFISSGTANVGSHQFIPASRTYTEISGDQPGQNYDTLIFGDVAAPFAERLVEPVSSAGR